MLKTYKIDFISDIHIDFWISQRDPNRVPKYAKQFVKEILKPLGGDVLLLAGDQGHYSVQDKAVLKELLNYYSDICLVTGNHDLYLFSDKQRNKYDNNSFNRVKEMKEFCENTEGLHYLDGDIVDIKGLKIGGTGMWYDVKDNNDWMSYMNDGHNIITQAPYIIPLAYSGSMKVTGFNTDEYYNEQVKKLKSLKGSDVIMTHICPAFIPDELLPSEYRGDKHNAYYYSNTIDIIKDISPEVCVFGHTHTQYDIDIENQWFVCNPLGYKGEKTNASIKQLEISKII